MTKKVYPIYYFLVTRDLPTGAPSSCRALGPIPRDGAIASLEVATLALEQEVELLEIDLLNRTVELVQVREYRRGPAGSEVISTITTINPRV
jgi:hypothetical protein